MMLILFGHNFHLDIQNVKDSVVVQTMRYMELLKELKKSGNKNKKTL